MMMMMMQRECITRRMNTRRMRSRSGIRVAEVASCSSRQARSVCMDRRNVRCASRSSSSLPSEEEEEEEDGCPAELVASVRETFDRAVSRAMENPYARIRQDGIVDFAQGAFDHTAGGGRDEDDDGAPPDGMNDAEIIETFVQELGSLFSQDSGVDASAVLDGEGRPGFVRLRLAPFQDDPETFEAEVDLWEHMYEVYGVLLKPGLLHDAKMPPGTFFACPLGRSEDALITGIDRLQRQLMQRKLLHGRW